jgi:hypothetical protein
MAMALDIGPFISPTIKLVRVIKRKCDKRNPIKVLRRRENWKKEFEEHLTKHNEYGYYCDAIIRDIRRIDLYPDEDTERKAMSPYYAVAIKDFYHRGIEVFYGVRRTIKKDMYGDWRFVDYSDDETTMVYCVGKIPFDSIKHIDWTRQEPHIYCRFKRGNPFEAKPFYAKLNDRSETVYEVKHFRPWDKKKGFWFTRFRR